MKNFILLFLLLQQIISITLSQPVQKVIDTHDINIVEKQVGSYNKSLKPQAPSCSINQYFDEEEGRCLGVAGGGKVLYISNTKSCGTNVLKPHCINPRYYYICKRNKTILAQCAQGQHFENRLQKCVLVDDQELIYHTIQPDQQMFDSIQIPTCEKPGSFPVPGDCTLFYICETNGHRMFQNVFKCPRSMAFDPEMAICSLSSTCTDTKSNASLPLCAPNIPRKITLLQNIDDIEKLQESTTEISSVDASTSGGDEKSTPCENYGIEDTTLTTDSSESTATVTMNNKDELASTTDSYTGQTTSVFMEFSDNFDSTSPAEGLSDMTRFSNTIDPDESTTYPMTRVDDITPLEELDSKEMETSEPSLQTSTLGELVVNEQYTTVRASTVDSTSSTYSTQSIDEFTSVEELDSSTEMETTEPTLQTSTLGESTVNEQYTTVGISTVDFTSFTYLTQNIDLFTPVEKLDSSIEMETTEPSLQTSTLGESVINEQYTTVGISTVDSTSSTYSTSNVDALTPVEDLDSSTEMETAEPFLQTSTLGESVLNEQYTTVGVSTLNPTSSTYSTQNVDEFTPVEELDSSTEMETTESSSMHPTITVYSTRSADEFIPEQPTIKTKMTNFTSTISLSYFSTPSSKDDTISESPVLPNDALLVMNELTTSTEETILSDTTTIGSSIKNTSQPIDPTWQPDQSNIVGNARIMITENSKEPEYTKNTTPDFAFSSSTVVNHLGTVSVETVTDDPSELNETSSEIKQLMNNFTSTLNTISSLESKLLAANKENDTLQSLLSKLKTNSSDTGTDSKSCDKLLKLLLADKQQNISSNQNENVTERQLITTPKVTDSRRTVSSHIALPLTSAVLNITDKFERYMRDMLNKLSTIHT